MKDTVQVWTINAGPCPYIPDKSWKILRFTLPTSDYSNTVYQSLIDRGWRRNSNELYQNSCIGCNRCIPLRIPVSRFKKSKSQRRIWNQNQDLSIHMVPIEPRDEYVSLYRDYQLSRHELYSTREDWKGDFDNFFCQSPVTTRFMEYRLPDTRLIGLGLIDILPESISSVYFLFDPDEKRRSLGIFSILAEIEEVKNRGLQWLHLGFWVPGNTKMDYKEKFFPQEVLSNQGWIGRSNPLDPVPVPRPWKPLESDR